MSRLCQLSLSVLCAAVLGMSANAEAQMYSWPFEPVSVRTGYTPYYTGYAGYGYSGYYGAPYSVSYSGGSGCRSCQTSAMYSDGCGCSPCGGSYGGGCATGNCSTGNCATTTNLAPAGGLTPRPDPAASSRTIEQRLERIERELKIPPQRSNATDRTYSPDSFNPVPGRGTRETESDTTVPSRGEGGDEFKSPINRNSNEDPNEPFRENPPATRRNSLKPPTTDGDSGATGTGQTSGDSGITIPAKEAVIPSQHKKPAPGAPIESDKSQTLRLDSRVTSRAVSPRERLALPVGTVNISVAAAKRPAATLQVDAEPNAVNVARN